MTRSTLSGRVGGALDPCAAIQVAFALDDGQEREIVFRLGAGRDRDDAAGLLGRVRGAAAARASLEAVWQYWNHTLGAINVETPDAALNTLANGWLLYQTMACRLWGRSGFYQSGGAFGFRDQLQDVMALVHAEAPLVRQHLLLCASRQFPEGDVQHWWHPPAGRGVRTHCSDDYLWLPMATCRYVTRHRRHRRARRDGVLHRGPRREPRGGFLLRPAGARPRSAPASTTTACARSSGACGSAPTACRSSARGTGTTA